MCSYFILSLFVVLLISSTVFVGPSSRRPNHAPPTNQLLHLYSNSPPTIRSQTLHIGRWPIRSVINICQRNTEKHQRLNQGSTQQHYAIILSVPNRDHLAIGHHNNQITSVAKIIILMIIGLIVYITATMLHYTTIIVFNMNKTGNHVSCSSSATKKIDNY